jgi:tetratricopeptide (TPR) repeat protein
MSSSQTCVVRCNSRFAYGERGLPPASLNGPAVPPDTDVDFEVTLERIVSTKSIADLTPEENLAEAHFKKSVGNEHFSAANYKLAVKCYQKAVNAVDSALPQLPAAARSVAQKLVVDCANNMVAAYLALDDLELAEQAVAVALQTDPNSVKGLYRAGQVSLRKGNFKEATIALKRALVIEPANKLVRAEYRTLQTRVAEYKAQQKAMAVKMVGGSNSTNSAADGLQSGAAAGATGSTTDSNAVAAALAGRSGRHAAGSMQTAAVLIVSYAIVVLAMLVGLSRVLKSTLVDSSS